MGRGAWCRRGIEATSRALAMNGHSVEAVSLNRRNNPETRPRLSFAQWAGIIVMTIVVAFLVCCSAAVFIAHAFDAYHAG